MLSKILAAIGVIIFLVVVILSIRTLFLLRKKKILGFPFFRAKVYLISYILMIGITGSLCVDYHGMAESREQVIAESVTRGSAAFLEDQELSPDIVANEERFVEVKTAQYQKKAEDYREKSLTYLSALLCYLSMFCFYFAFITEDGCYLLAEWKPHKLRAEVQGEMILFYQILTKNPEEKPDPVFCKYKNTEKNRERFACFLKNT